MFRSPLTQQILNYFDIEDTRLRRSTAGLEVQLVNPMALELEESKLRVDRESRRGLANVPLNIDNRGVYYRFPVPSSVSLPVGQDGVLIPPAIVQGFLNGTWINLTPYDDTLPAPKRISVDPDRASVPLSNRLLFSMSDSGTAPAFDLPIPNTLSFSLENVPDIPAPIDILITGQTYPKTFWRGGIERRETISFFDAGVQTTQLTWSQIDKIQVLGLPAGAVLKASLFASFFDYQLDSNSYIHPDFRGRLFPRLWSTKDFVLEESFRLNRFAGYEVLQSRLLPSPLTGFTVEPNTRGLYAAAGTNLYYIDRRESMPDKLDRAVLQTEPLYGLFVSYDQSRVFDFPKQPLAIRSIKIETEPYARAGELTLFRFLIEFPNGTRYSLALDGSIAKYAGNTGWHQGSPKPVSLSLGETGTYVVVIEMLDKNGNLTYDSTVYNNLALNPVSSIDLSSTISDVQGLGFDSQESFWAWTGSFLIPLKPHYDAFSFDPETRSLYFTDTYSQVQLL